MKQLLILLFLCSASAFGQQCSSVWVKGTVVDTNRYQTFYNLMVINRTTGKGVFGQPDGSFAVYVNPNDSIVLSVKGYHPVGFRAVPDSNCQFICEYAIMIKATELDEFVVKPLKTLQQIKEERATLAMRETRTITGLEAFQSPITALYERFSKKERQEREIARMEHEDEQKQVLQELLQLYVSYDVINLSDEEFSNFIDFLAIDENFLKTATDMELITFIKDKFEHYKRISN